MGTAGSLRNFTLTIPCLFHHRSPTPDSAHIDEIPEEKVVWRGDFTMHGMAKFSAVAYAVSGPIEYLDEVCM